MKTFEKLILYIVVPTLCTIGTFTDILGVGYSHTSRLSSHFTYVFVHKSVLHLIVNMLAYFTIISKAIGHTARRLFVYLAFVSAWLTSFIAPPAIPTVGLSGMLFFYIAALMLDTGFAKKWQQDTPYGSMIAFVAVASLQAIFANVNYMLHLYNFIAGAVVYLLAFYSKKIFKQ